MSLTNGRVPGCKSRRQKYSYTTTIGHWLTGSIADSLLDTQTKLFVAKLIPSNLSRVATWADEIKSQPRYDWARSLHYIDTADAPPRRCQVNIETDCAQGGCLTSTIGNYTTRLMTLKTEEAVEKAEALKFLIHFIGDLHQPLHSCGRDRGGTRAMAKFYGKLTNMHSVWDSLMIERRIVEEFGGRPEAYSDHLVEQIKSGKFKDKVSNWTTCPAEADPYSVSCCPTVWIHAMNQVNCDFVWPLYKRRRELGEDYYNGAIGKAEELVAMVHIFTVIVLGVVNSRN